MLKILLIRHGKTPGNGLGKYIGVTDEELLSEEEAALKGTRLLSVEAVYSSPLKRCLQTAAFLFPEKQAIVLPELIQCNYGRLEGRTYQEMQKSPEFRQWVSGGEIVAFPEGESRAAFYERSLEAFRTVVADAQRRRTDNIAIVMHGAMISNILSEYGFPAQKYSDWAVEPGEGYHVRLVAETFLHGNEKTKEIIVDRKMIRSNS